MADRFKFLTNKGGAPERTRGHYPEIRRERNTRFRRDVLAKLLLSGRRFTRLGLLDELQSAFPDKSPRESARVLGVHLSFLLKLGVLVRVGRSEFKMRESLFQALQQEGFFNGQGNTEAGD